MLLASAHPKLFCPGLDLVALAEYDRASMERFMMSFAVTVWALYGLPKPVVAAVGGAAVAGGCILALTADHRVLKRGAPIGLNEVKVGVPLPWSVTRLLRATVHAPALSRVALLGRNFTDAEAIDLGLADEMAEAEGFEATCLARLEEFADKDPLALATTKAWLREGRPRRDDGPRGRAGAGPSSTAGSPRGRRSASARPWRRSSRRAEAVSGIGLIAAVSCG